MSEPVLVRATGLTKAYPARGDMPEFRAVDGIGFELRRGETFGFLGPNGAGKSTTMRMIAATSPRSGGTLTVPSVTTFMRDFPDFQLIQLVMLPMYLFATTFYPLSTYPGWLRPLVEALPTTDASPASGRGKTTGP